MNTNNDKQKFIDAIAQLEKDKRFLEKKRALAKDPKKPNMTMMDVHYLKLIPSVIYNFKCIIEDIEDGEEPFDTDLMIAEAVNHMNGNQNNKQNGESKNVNSEER